MKNRSKLMAAATVALALAYPAFAAEPTASGGVSDEIQALKARLEQLETKQIAQDRQRQEAAKQKDDAETSKELLIDAQSHDQLLATDGFTAGYTDNRFVIQSTDGKFVFRPWLHLQFREVTLDRKDFQGTKTHPEDEIDSGFEVRRMRFGFDGNMFSPDFTYFFNWATSRTSSNSTVKSGTTTVGTVSNGLGGVPILEEAWVKYHLPTTPFYFKLGQIKDPVLHDQMVSSRYQHGAERSLTADIFTNGDCFTEGATFIYDPNTNIRTEAGINHGIRSANTNFLSYPDNGSFNQFNFGLVGRAEYKVMGRWSDYAQVGAMGTKEELLVFGAGADYSERGHAGQLVAVADAMYASPTGFNLYGAFVDRYTTHNFGIYSQSATGASIGTPDPAVANKATNEYSILAEVGYIFDHRIEPFGRYEYIRLAGTAAGSHNWVQAVTGGVNYFFHGNRIKLTGEVIWLPNGLPIDDSPSDVLTNSNGKTEISFVAQLQLLL